MLLVHHPVGFFINRDGVKELSTHECGMIGYLQNDTACMLVLKRMKVRMKENSLQKTNSAPSDVHF